MFTRFKISWVWGLFLMSAVHSQNISGVINEYAEVLTINNRSVSVKDPSGFATGDKVLLIQMQGATIDTTQTKSFGKIKNNKNTGNFEFLIIKEVASSRIFFESPVCKGYDQKGKLQLVRVAVYENATVTGPLKCKHWDGKTGGVLALEVTNKLKLKSQIIASGTGFRGGKVQHGPFQCGDNVLAGRGRGMKGEGIAFDIDGLSSGIAPLANGGGGSNWGNPGAGGGGGYGAGGRGGNEYSKCTGKKVYAFPGYEIDASVDKAFMGGGGGGGYADNALPVTEGGDGGGIVMIIAAEIVGNGNAIFSKGGSIKTITDSEGAGGGGAGGAVYLWVDKFTGRLNINVSGGAGGSTRNTKFPKECHGPGGGGGGGYVCFNSAALPEGVKVLNWGGGPGKVLNNSPCVGTPNGAKNGRRGGVLFNLPGIQVNSSSGKPDLGPDILLEKGDTAILSTEGTYTGYKWSNGKTEKEIRVTRPGTYWLKVPVGCDKFEFDTIVVSRVEETETDVEFGDNNIPVNIKGRAVNLQRTVTVPTDEFDIEIWDRSVVDGDSISLNLNGEWILTEYMVVKKKKRIRIKINPNFTNNYLILYAHNLGSISPNTAAVQVIIGDKTYKLTLNSDMKESGALNFEYKPE